MKLSYPNGVRFPGESEAYRSARNRLLEREIELRRLTEEVAALRRALPPGGTPPEDYLFHGDGPLRLSELFEPGKETLAIYSYMFGAERERPCPMCTALLDALDGVAGHIGARISFAVVAESPAARLRAWKHERRWNLRLLSSAGTSYNRDYFGKTASGGDSTMLNVFTKKAGVVSHFFGTEVAWTAADPGQDERAMDWANPLWALLDMTPEGRGDWYTKLGYDDAHLRK